ncbi:MAG: phosphopantetheine-binding protein [Acidimicrobiales bacterium]
MRNGVAYLSAYGLPQFVSTGSVLRGVILLTSYLFEQWPFRKLYLEVPEPMVAQFQSSFAWLVKEEGRLTDFEYSPDGYLDIVIASISRHDWHIHTGGAGTVGEVLTSRLSKLRLIGVEEHGVDGVLNLDEFNELVWGIIGRRPERADVPLVRLGADSLHLLEIVVAIEAITLTQIDIEEVQASLTVRDLYTLYTTHASMPPSEAS